MPEGVIYVGRPTVWGNPYKVGDLLPPELPDAVAAFEAYARGRLQSEPEWLAPLKGKDLACFCPLSNSCHADVLLRLANV